jgi:hypothetical protein
MARATVRTMAEARNGGRDGILARYTCHPEPITPEDAFLGAADPRPGRQKERDRFQGRPTYTRALPPAAPAAVANALILLNFSNMHSSRGKHGVDAHAEKTGTRPVSKRSSQGGRR